MRDDGQEDQEQEGQKPEETNAPEILGILHAIKEQVPVIWGFIKKFSKQSTGTFRGKSITFIVIYAYASLVGFLYEQELGRLFDRDFNLSHYLTFDDFPFLAVKNLLGLFCLVFGPLIFCIVLGVIIIAVSIVLGCFHLFVFKTHRYLKHIANMKWHGVKYLNYRDKIPDNVIISSKLKRYFFFAPLIMATIIKNLFILIIREFIPWLLHRVTSQLAWIAAYIAGVWDKVFSLLQYVNKGMLIILSIAALASPIFLAQSPSLVGYLPNGKTFQSQWRVALRGLYQFNSGQLRTARPERCIDDAKHISSTEKYAIFSLPEIRENGAGKLLVVPTSNLASYQVGEVKPCKDEKPKVTLENINMKLEAHAKAASMRDAKIEVINKSVAEINKKIDMNVNGVTTRDWESIKVIKDTVLATHEGVKKSAENSLARDGEIKKVVDATHEDVKKGVAIAGDVKTAADEFGTVVKSTHEAVIESAKVVVAAVNMTHRDVKKGVDVAGEIMKAVDATHEGVEKSAEDSLARDGEIKEAVEATHEGVKKSAEAADERHGEIKMAVGATHETVQKSAKDSLAREGEIKEVVEATHEGVKKSAEAAEERHGEIKMAVDAIQADVKKGVAIAGNVKTAADEIGTAVITVHEEVEKNAKAAATRDGEINKKVDATYVVANEIAAAAGTRDGEIEAIRETVEATLVDVKKGVVDAATRDAQINMAVDAAHELVKESAEATDERHSDIKMAVQLTHEAVIKSAKVVVAAVDATQADVKKSAEDSLARDGEIKEVVGESKKVIDRLFARHPEIPVTRFVTIDRTGSETRSGIRYLFPGFDTGEYVLNPPQLNWLQDFHNIIMSCENESRPSIRLVGFASSQDFPETKEGKASESKDNFCKSRRLGGESSLSDIKNCRLANQRVGRVAALFEHLGTKQEYNEQKYEDVVKKMMGKMDKHCELGEKVGFLPSTLGHIKIEPWCELGKMRDERISIVNLQQDKQPHSLNRSVHMIFENVGKCLGFSKSK